MIEKRTGTPGTPGTPGNHGCPGSTAPVSGQETTRGTMTDLSAYWTERVQQHREGRRHFESTWLKNVAAYQAPSPQIRDIPPDPSPESTKPRPR